MKIDHTLVSASDDSPDKPPVLLITVVVFITFVSVLISWFFAQAILNQMTNKVVNTEVETGMNNKARLLYVQQQDEYLNSYAKLENGAYKIPIQQAMKIVIQKENQ